MAEDTEASAGAALYRRTLQKLLPRGLAWPRLQGTVLGRLLEGLGVELWRVEQRALDLLREADPRTTSELLADWERVAGLPDPCTGTLESAAARRAALASRLGSLGGQSRAYFIGLAASLGYEVSITEFDAFHAGMTVGQPLYGTDWQFAWQVNAPEVSVRTFVAGAGVAGDPLRDWGNELLECTFARVKPAHSVVIFAYS
jgi:uncharacterized protein YmfQ (DUF2313 family)